MSQSRESWTALWRAGVLHACSPSGKDNYQGVAERFWHECFGRLKDGEVVVDIGTGNGAVALLAAQHARRTGLRLEVHGVDEADIDPYGLEAYAGLPPDAVRFHPNTPCETLPLPDGSVALLSSQFAFEYMDRAAVGEEILRVLAPAGHAALVMHSSDSAISQTLAEQLQAHQRLLRPGGVFDLLRATIEAGSPLNDPESPLAREVRELIAMGHALPRADVIRQALSCAREVLLQAPADRAEATRRLEQGQGVLRAHLQRHLDLQRAISTPEALREIAGSFAARGARVELHPLDEAAGERLGWALSVHAAPQRAGGPLSDC